MASYYKSSSFRSLLPSTVNEEGSQDESKLFPRFKSTSRSFTLLFLVMGWYLSATLSIVTSKVLLNSFSFPFSLCTFQFLMGTIISHYSSMYLSSSPSFTTSFKQASFKKPSSNPPFLLITIIAVSYTFGFIFTNKSFSLVHVSFAETVKASEPISSVLLGFLILKESKSFITYLTLVPICLGVAISCHGEAVFHFWGFAFALLSNFCFSLRAVVSKHVFKLHPQALDELTLFFFISSIGLLILIPLGFYSESLAVIGRLSSHPLQAITYTLPLLLINGTAYATYNLLSIFVLTRTDLVTHAVLNAFRRVFIIVTTSFFFRAPLTRLNIVGVVTAIIGVLLFSFTNSSGRRKT